MYKLFRGGSRSERFSPVSGSLPRRGFTLVELLVVIGIIAVLIAMLMPALTKARTESRIAACADNQRQIYMAVTMYAADNNGSLPGTQSYEANYGAQYISGQWYPWEFSDQWWYGSPDLTLLPPGFQYGSTARWFGVGVLIGNKYLLPTSAVACPDASPGDNNNFSYNDGFALTAAYAKSNGDPGQIWDTAGQNVGTYVLNSLPYYNQVSGNDNLANGKLGYPGKIGGDYLPASQQVPHITALLMCLSSQDTAQGTSDGACVAHNNLGVNVTYIDGHTAWMPISAKDWNWLNTNWPNSSEADLVGHWNSFWVLASQRQ
jgi:prepilin-type N-terminal cleavage/methylation domain-containing protein